jgi:hypothetical protein
MRMLPGDEAEGRIRGSAPEVYSDPVSSFPTLDSGVTVKPILLE